MGGSEPRGNDPVARPDPFYLRAAHRVAGRSRGSARGSSSLAPTLVLVSDAQDGDVLTVLSLISAPANTRVERRRSRR